MLIPASGFITADFGGALSEPTTFALGLTALIVVLILFGGCLYLLWIGQKMGFFGFNSFVLSSFLQMPKLFSEEFSWLLVARLMFEFIGLGLLYRQEARAYLGIGQDSKQD